MTWVSIAEILGGESDGARVGDSVTVKGWVRSKRDSKAGISFIVLSDGSCFATIQCVAPSELDNFEADISRITTGCSLEIDGELVESPGKGQAVEIKASAVRVIGWVDDPETYPASNKRHSFEYLREIAHLRPRTNTFAAIARIRNCLAQAIHRYFHERGYLWVHTPILTAADCEGAGELFRVSMLDAVNPPLTEDGKADFSQDFFGREAFLTVSGQLNVETYACALSKCYTFGPTFRAENSNTRRHLAEFWMIEPEVAFCDLDGIADVATDFLKSIIDTVLTERDDDMDLFNKFVDKGIKDRLRSVIDKPFRKLPYTEAISVLEKADKKFEFPVSWGVDLQAEHERYLTEEVFKQPLIVMDYPASLKAFYMRMNDDQKTVAAMDILAPGIGEIVGGSQREERLDVLDARLDALELPKEDYGWYRDLRRYGTVPHAGFGLGFERLIQYVTGMQNIRDVIPFPRAPRQIAF